MLRKIARWDTWRVPHRHHNSKKSKRWKPQNWKDSQAVDDNDEFPGKFSQRSCMRLFNIGSKFDCVQSSRRCCSTSTAFMHFASSHGNVEAFEQFINECSIVWVKDALRTTVFSEMQSIYGSKAHRELYQLGWPILQQRSRHRFSPRRNSLKFAWTCRGGAKVPNFIWFFPSILHIVLLRHIHALALDEVAHDATLFFERCLHNPYFAVWKIEPRYSAGRNFVL